MLSKYLMTNQVVFLEHLENQQKKFQTQLDQRQQVFLLNLEAQQQRFELQQNQYQQEFLQFLANNQQQQQQPPPLPPPPSQQVENRGGITRFFNFYLIYFKSQLLFIIFNIYG